MNCDQPDDRAADSAELGKLAQMMKAFNFHGIIMLSKPCQKCNGLHQWRMISTLPPSDGGIQQLLHHAAAMIDEGRPEMFDIVQAAGGSQ